MFRIARNTDCAGFIIAATVFSAVSDYCAARQTATGPLPSSVLLFQETEGDHDLTFTLDFRFMYGEVDGFAQSPSDGTPGTTSPSRPTLSEIGIDDASIFDASLNFQFDQHIFTAGTQFIRLRGSDTLSTALISESILFPAGTSVDSDVKLDWYRFGYQYEFRFDLGSSQHFRVAPGIEGVFLDFDYELDDGGALRAGRSYMKGGARLGGTAEWLINERFSLEASGWWGLPIDNTAEILSVEVLARCQLWGERNPTSGVGGSVYLGVAFENIEYEDLQDEPNHIDVDLGPLLVAGFEIRF